MLSRSTRPWITLIGVAISAGFVWLAVRHLDASAVAGAWQRAKPWPWLPLAVLAYVSGHLVRGARLRYLVRREAGLPITTASNVVIVGYATNNVLPARLGELARAGMLAERTGMPLAQSLTVTFIERILDGVTILFLLVASALSTHPAGWVSELARVGALVFGAAFMLLGVAAALPRLLLSAVSRVTQPMGAKWHDRLLSLANGIVNGAAAVRTPRDAAVIALSSLGVWLLESTMFVCVLPAMGLPLRVDWGLTAMSVTNLGILVPSTPGFIGPFHFFCAEAITAQGVAPNIALAYAVLVHLAFYVPATLWGAGAMLWYGVQVGRTVALARAARRSPGQAEIAGVQVRVIARRDPAAGVPAASPFDRALTEALLPPELSGDPASVREVSEFLAGQIGALPAKLRGLYLVGMALFRLWVRARHFSGFERLPIEARRAAVTSWAAGPLALTRQLFRAPRSTVLLAAYELPGAEPLLEPRELRHESERKARADLVRAGGESG
jgi:uncharacterized protein (TIRG00374 family)